MIGRVIERFPGLQSHHGRAISNIAAIAIFVFAAKLAGAGKEVAVAARYGTAPEVDAYNLIFNLMNWPISVWVEVLIAVMVPLLVGARNTPAASALRWRVLKLGIGVGAALALIFASSVWLAIGRGWLGAAPDVAAVAREMIAPLALGIPFGFAVASFNADLIAQQRRVSSLIDGVPSLVLIGSVLLSSGSGAGPLSWGTFLGFAAQLAVSVLVYSRGLLPRVAISGADDELWGAFCKSVAIVAVGQMITTAGTLVLDQLMVVQLGPSANAVLGYSGRLTMLVLSIGALAAARATLPLFSAFGDDQRDLRRRVAYQWSGAMFGLGAIAAIAGWLMAPYVISAIFQRGAFTASDTEQVTEVFRYSLLQVPFYFANIVLVQLLISSRKYSFFLWTCVIQFGVKYLANSLLIPAFGLPGVPLSACIRAAEALVFSFVFLRLSKA
ncbi:lipid II flippase MurJ [Caulobacter sp. 17J65-9]|uniref:lipid II flippase MurJ n=1 Tax=Caulobacter sp. 17J65-9 TaxID=2709382 RepID=UPI0013CC76A5|nr:lipid II flippase MurJ [Caulobacter sp. 17J65-9]NEX94405.1 hypothetical protein [Caulobacter sp. 17J65-9]